MCSGKKLDKSASQRTAAVTTATKVAGMPALADQLEKVVHELAKVGAQDGEPEWPHGGSCWLACGKRERDREGSGELEHSSQKHMYS